MLGNVFDKMLHDEDEYGDDAKVVTPEKEKESEKKGFFEKRDYIIAGIIFLIALIIRLVFIYKITDPQNPGDGWAGDTFHHWQIAYLTREIGLGQGFLRLWDLKGMEYFWGPLHPILLMIVFAIQGSASVVGARILSAVFGSVTIACFYLLGKKYWNRLSGAVAALLAATFPVAILDDTFGLLEQIAVAMLLVGIVVLESYPFLAGIIWALSAMVRAEAWIFGFSLLIISRRALKKSGQFTQVVLGWVIPMLFYLKYLLDYTGNAIYPVWWNYLANARGAWATEIIYTPYQLMIKPYLVAWFGVSVVLFLLIWWRSKGPSSVFTLFIFLYMIFMSGMLGLTHYLTGFQPWFWFIRFFEFPYIFLGFLISIVLFYYVPKHAKLFNNIFLKLFLFIPVGLIVLATQVGFWSPIMDKYNSTRPYWERTKSTAREVGEVYKDGTLLIPDGDPNITYALVNFNGIKGRNILGQMYDPYFYMEDKDPYANWGDNRELVLSWLKKDDIQLILMYTATDRYMKLFEKEPEYFEFVKDIPNTAMKVYRVFPERIVLENEDL